MKPVLTNGYPHRITVFFSFQLDSAMPMIEDMSVQDTVDRRIQSIKNSPGTLTSNITIMLTSKVYKLGTKLVNQYVIQSYHALAETSAAITKAELAYEPCAQFLSNLFSSKVFRPILLG